MNLIPDDPVAIDSKERSQNAIDARAYEELFRKKYEMGMEDYAAGRVRTNEDVEIEAEKRGRALRELIESRK